MNSNSEIPQQINGVEVCPSSVQDDLSTNEAGTDSKSDTPLTQSDSGFVRTFEDDRRKLIAKRVIDGPDTPDGHTYSNILELRKNWEKSKPGDFCQQHIPRLMLVQEERLRVGR